MPRCDERAEVAFPRLVRDPDLVVLWRRRALLIRNVRTGESVRASPAAVEILDAFGRRGSLDALIRRCGKGPRDALTRAVGALERFNLLVTPARDHRRLSAWNDNIASALYHAATRDMRYVKSATEGFIAMRNQQRGAGPRPRFKHYRTARKTPVPRGDANTSLMDVRSALHARRTTRDFTVRPVSFPMVAAIVQGTWGLTGWLEGGKFGRLPTRTSPSGGALHPIECYVVAMRVEGLEPGLYHYDVRRNDLRRLKRGDFRREVVRLASGQRWVGQAAFLCIMTAAFERTLWKYRRENAYRTVWLEAGHFAQTFSLLATSYGLGPFTTAAMQDSRIERFLGLDGIREFPVYLCGAGVPGPLRNSPRWTPLRGPESPQVTAAAAPSRTSPSKPRPAAPGRRRAPTPA